MKPNNISPSPILSIIPRLIIILIIRFKSSYQPDPFITVCAIDLDCVADFIQFSLETRAGMFYDVRFVAGGGTRGVFVVYDVVGPFPFGRRVGFWGGGGGTFAGTTFGHWWMNGWIEDRRDLSFAGNWRSAISMHCSLYGRRSNQVTRICSSQVYPQRMSLTSYHEESIYLLMLDIWIATFKRCI